MNRWAKRIGGVLGMGLIWAAGWAVLTVLIGTITESLSGYSLETLVDPLMAMAMPGFVGGVVYSVVLWIAEGRHRFDELSLPRLAAWGAVTGLLLGVLPFAIGTPTARYPLWLVVVSIIGSTVLLSTVSAVGSALLFRHTTRERPPSGVVPEG
jgi:hypothetical protein